MKTREEVEKLKKNWRYDPIWDIEETEGFEEYKDELLAYGLECKREWEERRQKRIEEEKKEAEKLGCSYEVYKLLERIQEIQDRHERAIKYLVDNETTLAWKALRGQDG